MQIRQFNNYVQPVMLHPVSQYVKFAVIEAVKILAAKLFLEFLESQILSLKGSLIPKQKVYDTVVFAPLTEEILATGFIQNGIRLIQGKCNGKKNLTQAEWKTQQAFRIHLTALIFASVHFLNPQKSMARMLLTFSWTYFGGLMRGYLSERYGTLSIGIILHGIHNSLTLLPHLIKPFWFVQLTPLFGDRIYLTDMAIVILGNRIITYNAALPPKTSGLYQTAVFWLKLPAYIKTLITVAIIDKRAISRCAIELLMPALRSGLIQAPEVCSKLIRRMRFSGQGYK